MKRIGVIVCVALCACVGTSEIVPMGRDSYLVTGHAGGTMNAGKSAIAATKAANEFCAKQGKFMIFRHSQGGGNAGFGGETDQLVFSCVSQDDPEYARPNLHKDPDTVVEHR